MHVLIGEREAIVAAVSLGERACLAELGDGAGHAPLLLVAHGEVEQRPGQRVEPPALLKLAAGFGDLARGAMRARYKHVELEIRDNQIKEKE
jgi:hypothetical protein